MEDTVVHDALIIGGGPAGLSAALPIVRQQFSAIIFDEGKSPIHPTKKLHLIPSWDHRDKDEFAASAKENILARYDTLSFTCTTIEKVRKINDSNFEAVDTKGFKWIGKKIVLATGVKYIFPDIDGYASCWGTGIAFEDRGVDSVGVIAIGKFGTVEMALRAATDFKRFANTVLIYTNGSESLSEKLISAIINPQKIKVCSQRIKRLEKSGSGSEVTVYLEDGTAHVEGFIGHTPPTKSNGSFVEDLGLEMELNEEVGVKLYSPLNHTNLHGVFVAGDICSEWKIFSHAFYLGNMAGAGVAEELLAESD
ncbi:FAD/NAD(P)-binding domain-containing protein [Lojkania enalia]|uniref:FAD/NAD(P)-binding domain-containing protein n=1 Tax=Lojkania enalia TaxID=147567 RepID=A0A9P4KFM2_9PLEO|nr:FAD/NAD(P)-binding domain-containing protein [Didymosphaeria enalia]